MPLGDLAKDLRADAAKMRDTGAKSLDIFIVSLSDVIKKKRYFRKKVTKRSEH